MAGPAIIETYNGYPIWYNASLENPYYIGMIHFATIDKAKCYVDRLSTPEEAGDINASCTFRVVSGIVKRESSKVHG